MFEKLQVRIQPWWLVHRKWVYYIHTWGLSPCETIDSSGLLQLGDIIGNSAVHKNSTSFNMTGTHTQAIDFKWNQLSQNQTRLIVWNADSQNQPLKPFADARSVVQFRTALSNGEAQSVFLLTVFYLAIKTPLTVREPIGNHTNKCGG